MRNMLLTVVICLSGFGAFCYASDPNFIVEPAYFSSFAFEGDTNPDPNVLTMVNNDAASVSWSIDALDKPDWLTISQTSGVLNPGEDTTVLLSYDITGLPVGVYAYPFEVIDVSGRFDPIEIDVHLKIIGAVLAVSEHTFYQSLLMDDPNPDPNYLMITNAGVNSLNWSIDTSDLPSWLTIDPLNGSLGGGETQAVMLSYDFANLQGGSYFYSFEIADPSAESSPQTVAVDVDIKGPSFEVSGMDFAFSVEEGSGAPDQFFTLVNSGGGTVNWSADLVDIPGWLSVSPSGGSLGHDESDIVTLSVDPAGLSKGQYDYTFEISDPAVPGSSHEILVRLLVDEPEWNILVPEDYPTIQEAIDAALSGDKIHVAAGTYVENITLKSGVTLVGESPQTCIIDGNQNGVPVITGGYCDSNTKLAGFTVTNGSVSSAGGGMRMWDSQTQISNCIFAGNSSEGDGGGIRCARSNLIIFDCVFNGNSAQGNGGGIWFSGGSLQFTNCSFIGNNSRNGGGIYSVLGGNYNSTFIVDNCNFRGNSTAGFWSGCGGAIYSCDDVYITNSNFTDNTSFRGGAIYNDAENGGSMIVMSSQFTGNSAADAAGVIYNRKGGVIASHCVFNGNSAQEFGGVMCLVEGRVMLINGTFHGNSARYGGAVAASPSLPYERDITLANCILWGDFSTQWEGYDELYNGPFTVCYSDIAGCGGSGSGWNTSFGVDGGGNIDADPLFVDADGADNMPVTDDDNLRLSFPSPCIDAGDNAAVILATTDLDGRDRFIDDRKTEDTGKGTAPIVDMGAYETESYATIWVNQDYSESGENDGHVWGVDAFTVIQDGLDAAVYGDTVKVSPGCYIESITLKNGVLLVGSGTNESTIRGGAGAVVTAQYCDPNTVLEGFTIMNGRHAQGIAFGGGLYINYGDIQVTDCRFINNSAHNGGGLAVFFGEPHISNCTFYGNTSTGGFGFGGGIYSVFGNPVIDRCVFIGNTSFGIGGGICVRQGSAIVNCCTFTDNSSDSFGGGIYGEEMTLRNSLFSRNKSKLDGGGAYITAGSSAIENCMFSKNTAGENGGGLYLSNEGVFGPDFNVTHCTFVGNSAISGSGGGIYGYYCGAVFKNCTFNRNSAAYGGAACFSQGQPVITNCILWGNTTESSHEICNHTTVPEISNSNIAGCGGSGSGWDSALGTDGGGNIDVDPLFVNAEMGDVHLKSQGGRWDTQTENWVLDEVTSPCIDAGDPYDSFGSEPFPNGGVMNMGAYGGTVQASKSYFGDPPCQTPYAGDINGDCNVDLQDLSMMAIHWLEDHRPD